MKHKRLTRGNRTPHLVPEGEAQHQPKHESAPAGRCVYPSMKVDGKDNAKRVLQASAPPRQQTSTWARRSHMSTAHRRRSEAASSESSGARSPAHTATLVSSAHNSVTTSRQSLSVRCYPHTSSELRVGQRLTRTTGASVRVMLYPSNI